MIVLDKTIAGSNEKLETWAGIIVGFDDNNDFIIEYRFCNRMAHSEDYRKKAVVSSRDAYRIAERKKAKATALPDIIYKEFGTASELPAPEEIKCVFNRILEYISAAGCRYRLTNLPGKISSGI